MPHGIDDDQNDDDFDLSKWGFPLPTEDESKNFADKKRGETTVNSSATYPYVGATKIIRTPEMFADEVARFFKALRGQIPNGPNSQNELMISVLTQDYLRFLLNQ